MKILALLLALLPSLSEAQQYPSRQKSDGYTLLFITSAKRSRLFPDVPAVKEAGMKDFTVETWWGTAGPARLPADVVATLNSVINASAHTAEMEKRFTDEGADPFVGEPGDLDAQLAHEVEGSRRMVREGGLKID